MTLRGRSGWVNSDAGARRPCSGSVVISSMGWGTGSSGSWLLGVGLGSARQVGAGDL